MTTLLYLPPEIIHSILIYSRAGPSLNLCCRSLHAVLRCAPNIIRARYLLACWHHAFEWLPCDNTSQPPRFVPVLPSRKIDTTLSMLVLDYCLRFPICNQATLGFVQDMVIKLPVFGNYRLIHSLVHRSVKKSSREARSIDGGDENEVLEGGEVKSSVFGSADHIPSTEKMVTPGTSYYLAVDEIPKRLFKDLRSQSTTYPSGQDLDIDDAEYTTLRRNLLSFGPLSELPPLPDLLLLLRILLLHRRPPLPQSSSSPQSSSAVNSHSGYPITKAVFSKSSSLLALLLTMGAKVNSKDNLPLVVAGRSNWVHGLRLMVEQDEEEIIKRRRAIDAIEEWFFDYTNGIPHLDSQVGIGAEKETTLTHCVDTTLVTKKTSNNHSTKRKRRRLSDRVRPDPRLLYEAVKAEAVQVTDYLMNEKGVAPDMKTIRALDRLSTRASLSSTSSSTPSSLSRSR